MKEKEKPVQAGDKAGVPSNVGGSKSAGGTKKLKITLVKSTISCLENQKQTVKALGLKKIRSFAEHNDSPALRGMLYVVKHLVKVEEI